MPGSLHSQDQRGLRRIPLQIALPAGLALALFVAAVFFVVLPDLEKNSMEFERERLRGLGDTAWTALSHFDAAVRAGRMDQPQAITQAKALLRSLRYGPDGKDYFWINDLHPTMIAHPYRPDLEGRDVTNFTDPHGKRLFIDATKIARSQGAGFFTYSWQWKDDATRVVPKLSYVRLFEPWGWVVGTGVYLDDVRGKLAAARAKLLIMAGVIFAVVTLPVLLLITRAVSAERRRQQLFLALRDREEQYRALSDNISMGVIKLGLDKKIQALNAQMKTWFPNATSGVFCYDVLVHPKVEHGADACVSCPAANAFADGQVHEAVRTIHVDGDERIFRVVASPVRDAEDNIASVIELLDDVTDQKLAEEALKQAHEDYRSIFDNAVEGIFQTTPAGAYVRINPALAHIYGFDSPEQCICEIQDIQRQLYLDPARREEFVRAMDEQGEVRDFESQVYRKDGSIIWISENARAVRDEAGRTLFYEGRVVDITQRKVAEAASRENQAYFLQLFANSPQAIALIDTFGKLVDVNTGYETLFGHTAAEVRGKYNRNVVVPEDLMSEAESFYKNVTGGLSLSKETICMHKDGRRIPVSMHGYPVTIDGDIHGIFYVYTDISERKAFEEQLSHQAFHDSLTALPNRALFMERLSRAVSRAKRRDDYNFAVLLLDLDKFKKINDSLGHQAGDELLISIAHRIKPYLRNVDTLARLGGDEFAIILEEFSAPREVIHIANRIQALMQQPFVLKGKEVFSSCSIGIVLDTKSYIDAADLLRDADIAMYRSKEQHRGRMVFNRKMHDRVLHNITLENELRLALANNELELYYQPIVAVNSQRIMGFEALVRWNHPTRGLLPPNRFIPIAEESGLIIPLGQWGLRQACVQLVEWLALVPENTSLTMNVNLSPKQFLQGDLVEFVRQVIQETGIPPAALRLEITENVIMHDAELAVEKLTRLKKLGVNIAIDDFGTGYSSLSYLQRFPIDCLKIDRSFISGPDTGENDEIVRAIVALAQNLGLGVVAEGVETETQLSLLRDLSCENAQGFMFSRPVSKLDAEDILKIHFA